MALETITDEGLVIIDNSEANWAPAPSYPIIEMFDEAGWARVDFHGYAASAWRQQCTSFMFKDPGFFKGLAPPPRKYEVMDGQHNQLRRPWDRPAAPAAGTPAG